MKKLTILLLVFPLSLWAQIRPDFLLADSAAQLSVTYAADGKLYAAWLSTRDTQIVFNTFDEMFNPMHLLTKISNTPAPLGTIVRTGNDTGLVSWWCQPFPPVGVWHIYGQFLKADGDTVGGNFRIDDADYSVPDRRAQDVTYLNDTAFVVMWSGNGPPTGDLNGIYGRLGNNSSGMVGGNLHLSDDRPSTSGTIGKVAANRSNGEFMVTWVEINSPTSKRQLLGRIFDKDGLPKTSSEIMPEDTLYDYLWWVDIQNNSNGEYIIVWSERRDTSWYIKFKRIDEDGAQVGAVETVNPEGSAEVYPYLEVAVDTNGDFLVVWEQSENGSSRIYAQRYSSDGVAIGINFKISFSPDPANHYFPSIVLRGKKIYAFWLASSAIQPQLWGKILDFDNPVSSAEYPPTSVPVGFVLYNNYPNPFNPRTNIEYRIDLLFANVRLDIYDLKGQLVKRLVDNTQTAGSYKIPWDATDQEGKILPSGVYFTSLIVNGKRQAKKIILLR